MPAYLFANIVVTDPDKFEVYRNEVPAVISQYGGRYLVRGGAVRPVEGDPGLQRVVILQFDTMEALQRFYHSDDYAPLISLRQSCTVSNAALLEGVAA